MNEILEIVQMYKTSDGKTFESKDEAIKHQIELNKPKVYLVEQYYSSSSNIEKAFMTRENAEKFKENLEKTYNDSHVYFSIKEVELGE